MRLASGDPIGAPESVPLVVDGFAAFCRERGWRVALPRGARVRRAALRGARDEGEVYLGDEAIIRCDGIDIRGPGMKKLRGSVSRVARDRIRADARVGPRLGWWTSSTRSASTGAGRAGARLRWPQPGIAGGRQQEMVLAVARDDARRVAGFPPPWSRASAPSPASRSTSCATSRARRTGSPSSSSSGPRRSWAAWGSCACPPELRRLGPDDGADAELGPRDRALKWVVERLNPFFQIKSLHDFNEKFQRSGLLGRWSSRRRPTYRT